MPNRKASTHRPLPAPLAQTLATNLRHLRQTQDLAQEHLAAKAHVSVQMIRRLEAGTANPTLGTLAAVAEALEISLNKLLDRD